MVEVMRWFGKNSLWVLIELLAAGITTSLAWVGWRRRSISGATEFIQFMLAAAVWDLADVAEKLTLALPGKIFWSQVSYLGVVSLPVFWVLLVSQRVGQRSFPTGRWRLIWLIPFLTLGMVFTNQWHRLHWSAVTLINTPTGTLAIYGRGPWFWVHFTYSYLLLLLGALWLVVALLRTTRPQRPQLAILLLGTLVSWIGNGSYVLGLIPGLDLTPLSFAFAGGLYAWAIFRFDLLTLTPIARETLIESIDDGVLVLNAGSRIVDLNPAAQRLLGAAANVLLAHRRRRR